MCFGSSEPSANITNVEDDANKVGYEAESRVLALMKRKKSNKTMGLAESFLGGSNTLGGNND